LASHARPVVVVTGHEREGIAAALAGLPVRQVHNPAYADGLSTSLAAGLAVLPPEVEAAVVCLGDMPGITAGHINSLLAGFDPARGRCIGVPTHQGKRGNPTLWPRALFDEMRQVRGDVGARHLIGANESLVYEVEFGDTAVLTDLDTPAHWVEYQSKSN
jgi:molybdenum cofactor cytidylyltransferase